MRLNLSTTSGALADVRMVAPQFEPRKKVANFCVRLRALEQINALLQIVGLYCGCLGHCVEMSVPGKGGIRLRRRKTYYLQGRIQVLRKGGVQYIFDVAKYIGVLEVGGGGVACMSTLRHSYRDSVILETKIFVI